MFSCCNEVVKPLVENKNLRVRGELPEPLLEEVSEFAEARSFLSEQYWPIVPMAKLYL